VVDALIQASYIVRGIPMTENIDFLMLPKKMILKTNILISEK